MPNCRRYCGRYNAPIGLKHCWEVCTFLVPKPQDAELTIFHIPKGFWNVIAVWLEVRPGRPADSVNPVLLQFLTIELTQKDVEFIQITYTSHGSVYPLFGDKRMVDIENRHFAYEL